MDSIEEECDDTVLDKVFKKGAGGFGGGGFNGGFGGGNGGGGMRNGPPRA